MSILNKESSKWTQSMSSRPHQLGVKIGSPYVINRNCWFCSPFTLPKLSSSQDNAQRILGVFRGYELMLVFDMDVCPFPLSCSRLSKAKRLSWTAPEQRTAHATFIPGVAVLSHSWCCLMQSTPVEVLAEGLCLFWLLLRVTLPWDLSSSAGLSWKTIQTKGICSI